MIHLTILLLLLWSLILMSYIPSGISTTSLSCIDTPVLLDFKKHADVGTPSVLSDWTTDVHTCDWKGITCTSDVLRRVSEIDISGWPVPLKGSLSASLARLTHLKRLFLARNNLTGFLPSFDWAGNTMHLEALDLHGNDFGGPLPPSLGAFTNLRYLDLSSNNLNGLIPHEFGFLESLVHLRLSHNQLSGIIPSTFKNLGTNLRGLYLDHNRLTGEIPDYLSKMMDLLYLALQDNNFIGAIPDDFLSIIRDDRLEVQNNYLTGFVNAKLETFDYLNLRNNCLVGYEHQKTECDVCSISPNPSALLDQYPSRCISVAFGKFDCHDKAPKNRLR